MHYIPPSPIVQRWDGRALGLVAALILAAAICGSQAVAHPTALLGFFAASLAVGWMGGATVLSRMCGAHGVVLEPPDVYDACHSLSSLRIQVRVGNRRKRRPVLFLTVVLETSTDGRTLPSPPLFIGRLDPRSAGTFAWDLTVRQRGLHRIAGVRAETTFPGSLVRYHCSFPLASEVLALPAIYRLDRRVLTLLIGRRHAGGRLSGSPAAMEEFVGVRDYRAGDNPRSIHLALSVRAADYPNRLVVREFEDPADDDVCVILDTAVATGLRPNDPAERELMQYRHEKSISFASALCRLFAENKYRVRFRAVSGDGSRLDIMIDRSVRDLPKLEAWLARVTPVTDGKAIAQILAESLHRSSATVLFISLHERSEERRDPKLAALTIPPTWQAGLVRQVVGA